MARRWFNIWFWDMSKPPKIDKNLVSNLWQARRIYACNCLLRAVASQPWPLALGESSHKPSHTYLFTRFLHSISSTCISHVTHSPHNGTTVISTCMYSRVAAGCEKCYGIFSLGVPLAVLGLHGSCSNVSHLYCLLLSPQRPTLEWQLQAAICSGGKVKESGLLA